MSTALAALIALAAIAATYFFCMRPALRGRGAVARATESVNRFQSRQTAGVLSG